MSEYPKVVKTEVSIGYIKDLIQESLILKGFVADDEDIRNFVLGHDKKVALNGLVDHNIPISYEVHKQKKIEVKYFRYGK